MLFLRYYRICITFLLTEKEKKKEIFIRCINCIFIFILNCFFTCRQHCKRYHLIDMQTLTYYTGENIIETELRAFMDNPLIGIIFGSSRSFD